ncbi:hypothetical protein UFOVP4_32 [uncultured Caudovirales phage]|uniref:Uncharacterized protein n=1 Tax=uncultured Caudovirales phage TaxID=2100421 RepID=A0A6J5TBL2_9CAUD|nr:hypothetical protein UFOVP4_32 [uncultured Caudovirales phage]CAB4241277.1 hypothetical protein UFOVP64_28 [uncultured Caudovirales phage]CAB5079001.1 hypothetical protein UFOVP145_42 [uncultured Caudovirales phage]
MTNIKPTCPSCGGEDVGCEASAVWNVETQAWELSTTYDNEWCNACGDSHTHLIWTPIEEPSA